MRAILHHLAETVPQLPGEILVAHDDAGLRGKQQADHATLDRIVQGAAKAASRQETGDIRPVDHGVDTGCHQFRLQANSKLTGTETVNENAHRDATPGGAGHGCGDGTTRRVILEDVAFEMDLMPGFVDRLDQCRVHAEPVCGTE
ncbi:MAG: hypothetical protein V5B44_13260 [Candidatus Accumulibacter necessarius]|uniref:hypothetical protein n=1 Tax=Candidatus Accumulibacter necessarius TaxID=2954386 RepID=UPI002FC32596